jgi:hypothetical protein
LISRAALLLVWLSFVAQPAWADETQMPARQMNASTAVAAPVPWVAAGLTLLPAGAVFAVTWVNHAQLANGALPLLLGAGEFYAGDPWRAIAVSTGGYGAIGLGALGGVGFGLAFPGGPAELLGNVLNGGAVGLLAYSGWATYDAYQTAERRNAAHRLP